MIMILKSAAKNNLSPAAGSVSKPPEAPKRFKLSKLPAATAQPLAATAPIKPWGAKAAAAGQVTPRPAPISQSGANDVPPAAPNIAPTKPLTKSAAPQPTARMSVPAIAKLAESGIAEEQAKMLGMYSVENARAELGFPELQARPGLVIP